MRLLKFRHKIDVIDQQILNLLNERARLAIEIGKEKKQNNMSILNKDREDAVLSSLMNNNSGPLPNAEIKAIFGRIIKTCRNIQRTNS